MRDERLGDKLAQQSHGWCKHGGAAAHTEIAHRGLQPSSFVVLFLSYLPKTNYYELCLAVVCSFG